MWEDVIDDPDPRWLELLRLFNTVKNLRLSKAITFRIAKTLRRLPAEHITEVLPVLENVFISRLVFPGPVKEAISKFADAWRHSGHPVFIYNWDGTM